MTQEDKKLLLKDLCGRLPYHVRVKVWLKDGTTEEGFFDFEHNYGDVMMDFFFYNKLKDLKPYLRPMSSMTDEEKIEYYNTMDKETQRNYPNSCDFSESVYYSNTVKTFDWLKKKHFNYRNLPEHLYIKVTKENNPYE